MRASKFYVFPEKICVSQHAQHEFSRCGCGCVLSRTLQIRDKTTASSEDDCKPIWKYCSNKSKEKPRKSKNPIQSIAWPAESLARASCFCLRASRNSWCSADSKLNMLGCTQHHSIPPLQTPAIHALSVLLFIVKYLHTDDMLSSRLPSAHSATRCVHGPAGMSDKVGNMDGASLFFPDILKQKSRGPDTDIVSDRYLKRNACIMLHICMHHRTPVLWLPPQT